MSVVAAVYRDSLPRRVQDRADGCHPRRTHHAGQRAQGVVGESASPTTTAAPNGHQPGADRDDGVDVLGVLQHPQGALRGRARGRGAAVRIGGILFDEAAGIGDVERRHRRARSVPSAASAAERTAVRSSQLGVAEVEVFGRRAPSAASRPSTTGRPAPRSARSRVVVGVVDIALVDAQLGTRPTLLLVPGRHSFTALPADRASVVNCVPATRPRTSPGTGSARAIDLGSPRRGARGGAQGLQHRHRARIPVRSGHGRPVRSAATES